MAAQITMVVLLLGGCTAAGTAWRTPAGSRLQLGLLTGLLGCLGLLWWLDLGADRLPLQHGAAITLLGVLAVAGGGPLCSATLWLVDRGERDDQAPEVADGTVLSASAVLRGGAWIGSLERAAVFATLVAGWPEGLALVLAVKGLGRYPELRSPATGAAERFIIGTFVSVLWACACAGPALVGG